MRSDLGRELSPGSAQKLAASKGEYDLAIAAADGLSPIAVQRHVAPLLERLLPALSETWRIAPIVIAEQARVGLGDAICSALGAASVLVLIGERPGLSATDSLGAYVTGRPNAGLRTPTGIVFRTYGLRASPMTRPRDRSPICSTRRGPGATPASRLRTAPTRFCSHRRAR